MLVQRLKAARGRGVPLIAVETADQQGAVSLVCEAANGKGGVVTWDAVRGVQPARSDNDLDVAAAAKVCSGLDPAMLVDFSTALDTARSGLPKRCFLVCLNPSRFLQQDGAPGAMAIQAVANLRDSFAASNRSLVLLCQSWAPPGELGSDVHVLSDPLPDEKAREGYARRVVDNAGVAVSDDDIARAVASTRGLSRFVAEQTIALSLSREGLDRDELQKRFVAAVNATPGLTFRPPVWTLDDIGGLANIKAFLVALSGAKVRFDAIVFVDEIEKMIAGIGGDTSGVAQDQLGVTLSFMEDTGATGFVAFGPPGSGKSMSAVAASAALGIPLIQWDAGAMKGRYIGQSEGMVRGAFKTLRAFAPRTLWIATCNSDSNLPPELMRRYGFGTWLFDLLAVEEKEIVWQLKGKKYGVDVAQKNRPDDEGWTGAEIETACRTADNLGITPKEAAQWIVPVSVRAAEMIDAIRRRAHNRYVSASTPGPYQYSSIKREAADTTRRRFEFDGEE